MKLIGKNVSEKIIVYETLRRMMHFLINNVSKESEKNIASSNISQINEVRQSSKPLIGFGKDAELDLIQCRQSLKTMLYQHKRIQQMSIQAHETIQLLFDHYRNHLESVPKEYEVDDNPERAIADFISGMTDRFAINLTKSL